MYKGYVLQKNFPSPKLVQLLVDHLFQFLYPVLACEADFASQQLQLQEQVINLYAQITNTSFLMEYEQPMQIKKYFEELQIIQKKLLKDAEYILAYDPAAYSLEEVLHTYPGFYAITIYRVANHLHKKNIPILPRMMSEIAHSKTGIDIHAGATIGCPFFIDHGTGIVIGETTIIGDDVKLYQGVTLGAMAVQKAEAAIKRHPTIKDNVVIYSGSTILGGGTVIGSNSIIGGNTWLTSSIPANSVVYHSAQTVIKDRNQFSEPINFII